jgi:hypothetical protein
MDYSLLLCMEVRDISAAEQASHRPDQFVLINGSFRATDQFDKLTRIVYHVGIIDILQCYNFRKKVEHVFKISKQKSEELSCVNPVIYSTRFQDFLR